MPRGNKNAGNTIGKKTRFGGERAAVAGEKGRQQQRKLRPMTFALKGIAIQGLYAAAPVPESQKKQIAEHFGIQPDQVTMAHLAIYKQIVQAAKGSLQALVFIRDMAGEKPAENVNINAVDYSALDQVVQALGNQ